ncbi:quinone oxidoreductase family protein [Taibaiella soli]|uniref:Alcohol dehydrogenase n=1 Tax=Taibaiella soli TaxID=1649169 RepID=A0A2W2AHW7_9BACT|nr:zinc-binding dehydrogenase [Taibaiella soli]PZF71830.1 alcohol dehydrogenase [Taibaiella soli]
MKAIVLEGINEPLQLKDVNDPIAAPGEVIVKLKAAAFNRRDWWIQHGQYAGLKFPIILGSDGCGVVAAVGEGVDASWIGKEVIIDPSLNWGDSEDFQQKSYNILGLPHDGTFAELVNVPAANLHLKPAYLTAEEAAAFPLAGVTAFRALFTKGKCKAGDKVLIVGVGGGAAMFALQFAVAAGAEVYVTSSSQEKIDMAVEMGAKGGVNYKDADWAAQLKAMAGSINVAVDSALGEGFAKLTDLAAPGGRIVFFGGTAGDVPALNGRHIFWKQLTILGSTMGTAKDFQAMLDFINEHQLRPVIDEIFPMEDADQALHRMDTGSSKSGKIVLTID